MSALGQILAKPSVAVELPFGVCHVWEYFQDLHAGRGQGFNGWLPLSHAEILAWCELTGERLRPWELSAIRAMDVRLIHGEPAEPEVFTPARFKEMFGKR